MTKHAARHRDHATRDAVPSYVQLVGVGSAVVVLALLALALF